MERRLDYYDPGPNVSIGTATLKLVGYLHGRDPNLQLLSTQQQKSVRVNQSEGLITALRGRSPNGGPETDVLLTVARPQGDFLHALCFAGAEFPAIPEDV